MTYEDDDAARFWERVDRSSGPDACWIWTGAQHAQNGYGYLTFHSRQQFAHRVAYELSGHEIPPGAIVMRTCENPLCCNPAHLRLGSRADQMEQRSRLRRVPRPEE